MEETNQSETQNPQPVAQNAITPPPPVPETPPIQPLTEQIASPQTPETPAPNRLKIFLILIGLILILVAGSFYFLSSKGNFFIKPEATPTPSERACTQEAMICPDGSAVGRTGPNCEFAPCPSIESDQDASIQNESSPSAITDRKTTQDTPSCKDVDLNPKELTFEAYYCNGTMCSAAETKTECEAKDIVKVANGKIAPGTDGEIDCHWTNNSCQPNN